MDAKLIKQWKEMGNLYHILGLEDQAPSKKIKKAYKLQALVMHPDKSKAVDASNIFTK